MDEPTQERLFAENPGRISPPSRACISGPPAGRTPTGKGPLYPEGLPVGSRLAEYARHYATVEIDSTFYGTPRRSTVERWREISPEGFRFAAKFPQEITHDKDLVGTDELTRTFVDTMRLLLDRLGPLLVQLPPSFSVEGMGVLEDFLSTLPEGVRYAVEVRHRSWLGSDLPGLLREHGVALTLIDYPRMPRMEDATADFVYIRWLGDRREFPSDHTHPKRDRTGISHGGPRGSSTFSRRAARSSPTRTTTTRTTPPRRWSSFWRSCAQTGDVTRTLQYRFPLSFRARAGLLLGRGVGLDGVEIMMDERWDTHQRAYLEHLQERHGVKILALHPPLRRGAWNLGPEETLVRTARLAHGMDVPVVVAHPPPPGRSLERWAAGPLREAREQGVSVAVENMPR